MSDQVRALERIMSEWIYNAAYVTPDISTDPIYRHLEQQDRYWRENEREPFRAGWNERYELTLRELP